MLLDEQIIELRTIENAGATVSLISTAIVIIPTCFISFCQKSEKSAFARICFTLFTFDLLSASSIIFMVYTPTDFRSDRDPSSSNLCSWKGFFGYIFTLVRLFPSPRLDQALFLCAGIVHLDSCDRLSLFHYFASEQVSDFVLCLLCETFRHVLCVCFDHCLWLSTRGRCVHHALSWIWMYASLPFFVD